MKRFTALLLALVLCVFPLNAYAKQIEGADIDTRASKAGLDIYDFITTLLYEYAGGDLTPEQLYEAALRGISEELDDYSGLLTEEEFKAHGDGLSGNYEGIGVVIAGDEHGFTYIKEVFEGSPAEKAGLKPLDIIQKVNGKNYKGEPPYVISDAISSAPKTFTLEVLRGGKAMRFTLTKAVVHQKTAKIQPLTDVFPDAAKADEEKIGYIYISLFGDTTGAEFEEALDTLKMQNVEFLILDLRGNPGGYLDAVCEIADLIVPAGVIFTVRFADGEEIEVTSALKSSPFKHITVLTDGMSASASELLASALQDSKAATVIGQTTFGKGSIQHIEYTLTGGAFTYTIAHYYRRNGGTVNKKGVTPDIAVPYPTFVEDYATNESEAKLIADSLKKALTYLGYKPGKGSGYDSSTKKELLKFQKDMNLKETGIPDEDTVFAINLAMLEKYYEKDYEIEEAVKLLRTMY